MANLTKAAKQDWDSYYSNKKKKMSKLVLFRCNKWKECSNKYCFCWKAHKKAENCKWVCPIKTKNNKCLPIPTKKKVDYSETIDILQGVVDMLYGLKKDIKKQLKSAIKLLKEESK